MARTESEGLAEGENPGVGVAGADRRIGVVDDPVGLGQEGRCPGPDLAGLPAFEALKVPTDLFTVEVVNPFGLVRYHVLFVIDIATRCVCIGGMTSDPNGEWMKQAARNLTDNTKECLAIDAVRASRGPGTYSLR